MKVGTDGTLLGAWADGGSSILDVGTGTGLIALMMAQRFPDAEVTGIDIDDEACLQALENVTNSPYDLNILHKNLADMDGTFQSIVSNPPFFDVSLQSPDKKRTLARHTLTLSYHDLMEHSWRLLTNDGELSVIIPAEWKSKLESEALLTGFFKSRECAIKTTPKKNTRRYLLAYRKHPVETVEIDEEVLEIAPNVKSEWYAQITQDFYL
jgi:tRNA1Val (adenine37-N6)-methyltransferase